MAYNPREVTLEVALANGWERMQLDTVDRYDRGDDTMVYGWLPDGTACIYVAHTVGGNTTPFIGPLGLVKARKVLEAPQD